MKTEWQYSNPVFYFIAALFAGTTALALATEIYIIAFLPFTLLIFYGAWQKPELFFYFLLLSLSFSIEYQFSASLGTDLPDEPMMALTSFLFLGLCIFQPKAIRSTIFFHPLIILLLIALCWTLITVLFSSHSVISIKFLLAKSWYLGAFLLAPLILFQHEKKLIRAALFFSAGVVAAAALALFRHAPYGFRFAFINDALSPFFRNHVNYSALLVCTVPVLIAFYSLAKTNVQKWLAGFSLSVLLLALFFSFSRGAWLALVAGLFTYWLIRQRKMMTAYVLAIMLTVASVFWLRQNDNYLRFANDFKTTIFHQNFSEHLIATYKLKDVSTAERFYRWVAGIRMIPDKPVTGFGPGTFYENYKGYGIPAFKTWVSDNEDRSTVHNYFLLTTIEQGVPGLIFLLLVFGAMLYYAQHLYHRVQNPVYKSAALATGVITVMLLILNFLSDLIETDKTGSIYFLCMAVLVATDVNTQTKKASDSSPHL